MSCTRNQNGCICVGTPMGGCDYWHECNCPKLEIGPVSDTKRK